MKFHLRFTRDLLWLTLVIAMALVEILASRSASVSIASLTT
jgi:hypothetical protein